MSSTAKNTAAKTSAVDAVVEEAAEKKLVTEVPAQATSTDEQNKTEEQDSGVTEEVSKKSAKERVAALVQKAKDNKQFFVGFAAGVVVTTVTLVRLVKEKVEETELTIAEESDGDEPTDENSV